MPEPILNPTADQLEAGGVISGTIYGALFAFTDQMLTTGRRGHLQIEEGVHAFTVAWVTENGRDYADSITVTSYTPPRPAPVTAANSPRKHSPTQPTVDSTRT